MEHRTTDQGVLDHIEALVAEEHSLHALEAPQEHDRKRLTDVEVELDRCWDLLRQRRARREFGRDPNEAELRPGNVVENYEG
jgi:hypothetical protein